MKLIENDEFSSNPYVDAFLSQFEDIDTDRKACFLFPESFVSQFFVIAEVCRQAEVFRPVNSLFPDEEKVHYLAVFDKENMDTVLLIALAVSARPAGEVSGKPALSSQPGQDSPCKAQYRTHPGVRIFQVGT